jgi:hypothetical protein
MTQPKLNFVAKFKMAFKLNNMCQQLSVTFTYTKGKKGVA